MWSLLPFVPDTTEITVFHGYVYQTVDINSCGRDELEALPFLTPEQIENVLKNRPYHGWKDFLRRSGLPLPIAYALRGLITFGNGRRYYGLFVRSGLRNGEGSLLFSFKGRTGNYVSRLYLSRYRRAVAVGYYGKVRLLAGNYVMASPLGFAGYGGFYTGGWGPRYSPYSPPSIVLGVGLWNVKVDTVGLIGGITGRYGGLLLLRTWSGTSGGVGYFRYGPVVLESALSEGSYGLGVAAVGRGVGFRFTYTVGEKFWEEGGFSRTYALWFSVPLWGYSFRTYVSQDKRRVSVSLYRRDYGLRLEYYEVPRLRLYVKGVEAGICSGCMWGGYRWRWGWFRLYSFTISGIHIYEGGSSRLITSSEGFRLSFGLGGRQFGVDGYLQEDRFGMYLWSLLNLH